ALPLIDLAGLPDAESEALWLAREEARRPFDLENGPLLRANLIQLGELEHWLLLNQHHIVSDGASLEILAREISTFNSAPALPPPPIQYADFAVWQRQQLTGPVLEHQLAWWRERLAGAPAALELLTDRPRPAVQSGRGGMVPVVLPPEVADGVAGFVRRGEATLFMTLLAGFAALLHRYAGSNDIMIGTPVANRGRTELEGLIGFFVNTLPLRVPLAGDPSFAEILRRSREVTLGAHLHQDLPFERLVEELQPVRDPSRNPLFQVFLAVAEGPAGALRLPGITATNLPPELVHSGTAKADIALNLNRTGVEIAGGIEYAVDLFDAATMQRLGGHLSVLLAAAAGDPSRALSGLPS